MRRFAILVAALALVAVAGAVMMSNAMSEVASERVVGDVFVLKGLGGNVGVLRTGRGPVVVDSMTFQAQGEAIRHEAEELGGGPVQALINTHWHTDHTHGNPAFEPGTAVVSTRRTLEHLRFFDAASWEGAAAELLPNDVFEGEHELRIGGKTIRLFTPGRGHTDGDLVVLFVEDRVLHTGDLFFHAFYPNIDLESGGSVREWIETLDRVLEIDFDRVIPGHGPVTDAEGIRDFQEFLRELWTLAEQAAAEGLDLEATLASAELTRDSGYGVIGVPLIFRLDRDFVVQRAWEEATGSFEVQNP